MLMPADALARWLSTDPKAHKFPSLSPYHALANNPIITIDPDGGENIIVVGNQGKSPISGGGPNSWGPRDFPEAGLNKAIDFHKNRRQNGEQTTLLLYKGTYTDKQINHYKKKATAAGVNFIVVKNEKELKNHLQNSGYMTEKGKVKKTTRANDLITDFAYVGHAGPNALYLGYDADGAKLTSYDFSKYSFHEDAFCDLNGCGTGAETILQKNGTRLTKQDKLFQRFKNYLARDLKAYRTTVWWGDAPVGSYRPSASEYARPADRAALKGKRKTIKKGLRVRWSSDNKGTGHPSSKKVNGKEYNRP